MGSEMKKTKTANPHTGIYRVRRGLFGSCVLQERMDYPYSVESQGYVDQKARVFIWEDVDYSQAPKELFLAVK